MGFYLKHGLVFISLSDGTMQSIEALITVSSLDILLKVSMPIS